MMKKILIFTAVSVLLAATFHRLIVVRQQLRAKETVTKMRRLDRALRVPGNAGFKTIEELVLKSQVPLSATDAWGNEFVLDEYLDEDNQVSYKIRSLGRDGKRGECCKRWVDDLDEDAVIAGGEWLQAWR